MDIYTPISSKNLSKITNSLDLIYGNAHREKDVDNDGYRKTDREKYIQHQ
jgi:hypothetical protein